MTDHADTDLTTLPPDEARALIRAAANTAMREGYREASSTGTTEDRTIALDLLTREVGQEAALERLALNSNLSELAPRIAEEKATRQRLAEERERADYAQSPAGRREAASVAAEEAERTANRAVQARALLLAEGRNPVDLIEEISDEEALDLAGMADPEPQPESYFKEPTERDLEIRQLSERWWNLAKDERQAACQELGLNFEQTSAAKLEEAANDPKYIPRFN